MSLSSTCSGDPHSGILSAVCPLQEDPGTFATEQEELLTFQLDD